MDREIVMLKENKILKEQIKIVFIVAFIWGIFAHGFIIFNKLSVHDDMYSMFYIGSTYYSGRWALGILEYITRTFLGGMFSLPVFNGLITLFFISLILIILLIMFEIKNVFSIIILGGIFTVYPTITTLFGYMYTAPYYFFGFWLVTLSAFIVCTQRKWYLRILAVILFTFSIGIYQASIPLYLSIIILYIIKKLSVCTEHIPFRKQISIGIYHCIITIISFGVYVLINRFCLIQKGLDKMTDYQGISSFGLTSISGYFYRIIETYKEFIFPSENIRSQIYPFGSYYVFLIIVLIYIFLLITITIQSIKKKIFVESIEFFILGLGYPLFSNFIFIMCDSKTTIIHSIMMYSNVMFYFTVVTLMERGLNYRVINKYNLVYKGKNICLYFLLGLLLISSFQFSRFSNTCYLRAVIMQQENISYLTTLVTRIKSVEGYDDEYPVVYIGSNLITDSTIADIVQFNFIGAYPYLTDNLSVNDYAWKESMRIWCGFSPIEGNKDLFKSREEVINMSCYPDDGSIKIIDGTVVVKFN